MKKIICLIKGHNWLDDYSSMRRHYDETVQSGLGYKIDFWYCTRCGIRKSPDEMRAYGVHLPSKHRVS